MVVLLDVVVVVDDVVEVVEDDDVGGCAVVVVLEDVVVVDEDDDGGVISLGRTAIADVDGGIVVEDVVVEVELDVVDDDVDAAGGEAGSAVVLVDDVVVLLDGTGAPSPSPSLSAGGLSRMVIIAALTRNPSSGDTSAETRTVSEPSSMLSALAVMSKYDTLLSADMFCLETQTTANPSGTETLKSEPSLAVPSRTDTARTVSVS